jgi:hypothetical protein
MESVPMSAARTLPGAARWLLPLLLGAVLCAGLWAVGLPELGWIGFVAAAFLGPSLHRGVADHTEEPG